MSTRYVFKGYAFQAEGAPPTMPPEAIALVDEAVLIRGWCVQSFAQIEFLLAALIEGAGRKWPEAYGHLSEKMPFAAGKRPGRVRALLALEGPLKVHASEIELLMVDFDSFEEFRHLIVHGWADVLKTPSRLMLRWRRYQPTAADPWNRVEMATTIETLREQGEQAKQFAHGAVLYLRDLFMHYNLED